MDKITETAWLDTHRWGVRGFNEGGRSQYNGFQFSPPGDWITAPDWNATPQCGGGFHCLAPHATGGGFFGSQIELVEIDGAEVVVDGNKLKVEKMRRVEHSRAVLTDALRRCGIQILETGYDYHVTGMAVTHGNSAPLAVTIKGGGWLDTYDNSAPGTVTIERGGSLYTYGNSAPGTVTIKGGGSLYTYHNSAPGTVIRD